MQQDHSIHHILFDLDNTLWDFSGNSKRILAEIYRDLELSKKGISDFGVFYTQYTFRNEYLWQQYSLGNVTREEVRHNRFYITLNDFGIQNHALAAAAADYYILHTRHQKDLLPHAIPLLEYAIKKYRLHIITNGFDEVQFFKLENTGLRKYFDTVTTAENAKSLKPNKKIFYHALASINTIPEHCVFIGDSPEADGQGATQAGMDFIWYNPEGKKNTYGFKEVRGLEEIMKLI